MTTKQRQHAPVDQLRLALIELARIEREFEELVPRVRDAHDRDLLRSLRGCRESLLRMAGVQLARQQRPEA